jgi:ADP-ribose pyrophosphatase YjhB (NUDIX family)
MALLDGWRLCPRCGHELEPREHAHLGCPACGSDYYANSAPAVQGVLEREGKVLLARRAIEPRLGHWDLPGGFLEEGEEALDGLRREFEEETGLAVEPVDWLGACLDPYAGYWVLGLTWLVRADGEPRAADDVSELRWFGPDELPGEMAFPSQERVLRAWAGRLARDGRGAAGASG